MERDAEGNFLPWYPLREVGSKAQVHGVFHHKYRKDGLPKATMAGLDGRPLDPKWLCSHTIAQNNAAEFYRAVIDAATQFDSAFTPQPMKWSCPAMPCDGDVLNKTALNEWRLEWCTDEHVIFSATGGGKSGRALLFGNKDVMVNRILQFKTQFFATGLAPSLRAVTKASLAKQDRQTLAKMFALARKEAFERMTKNPEAFGLDADWRPKEEPPQHTTHVYRLLDPQDPQYTRLEGHLPGNINPDHSLPWFK